MENLFEKYRRFSEDYLRQNGYVVNGVMCRTYADDNYCIQKELKAVVDNNYVFNIPKFKDIEDLKEKLDDLIEIDKKI